MSTIQVKTPYESFEIRGRKNSEFRIMLATHKAIAAQGGLDTQWGHKLYAEILRVAQSVQSGVTCDFSTQLPHGAGLIKINSMPKEYRNVQ